MSGGHFDYAQFRIEEIIDSIVEELEKQGKPISSSYDYVEGKFDFYPTYSKQVQKIFKDAIKSLKIAKIYTQRIDWFLSGDDGEESLIERLREELGLEEK